MEKKYNDKFDREVINRISDNDFDKLIKEVYGHDIEVCAVEENLYDSSIDFEIDGEVSDYYEPDLAIFVKNGWYDPKTGIVFKDGTYPRTHVLLNDMCRRGLIDKGSYTITNY